MSRPGISIIAIDASLACSFDKHLFVNDVLFFQAAWGPVWCNYNIRPDEVPCLGKQSIIINFVIKRGVEG